MTRFPQVLRRRADGLENILISRTAACIPGNRLANLLFIWIPRARQQLKRGQHHSRGTVTALQAVAVRESFLDGMKFPILLQTLDGDDFGAVSLHGEHRAGLHRGAVQQNRAGPAVSCIAADVSACQIEILAQEFHQQQTGLDLARMLLAVHPYTDGGAGNNFRHKDDLPPPVRHARDVRRLQSRAGPAPPRARACIWRSLAYRFADQRPREPLPPPPQLFSRKFAGPEARSLPRGASQAQGQRSPKQSKLPCTCRPPQSAVLQRWLWDKRERPA